jgi:hypothetical protein
VRGRQAFSLGGRERRAAGKVIGRISAIAKGVIQNRRSEGKKERDKEIKEGA